MEDYEAQEIEFWAKLEEEGMSRSSMLRRSAAAAFGLTIVGGASTAFAANKAAMAPPTRMTKAGFAALIKAAKKEGHLNTIALPPDWANYKEALHNFPRKYGIAHHERQPGRQLGAGERGDPLAQGRQARSGRRRRHHPVRNLGRQRRAVREVLQLELQDDPACPQGHPRLLDGATTGAPSRSATTRRSSRIPRRRSRTC